MLCISTHKKYIKPEPIHIIETHIFFTELVQNAVHKRHDANNNLQGYGVRKSEVTRWVHKIIYVIYCVILTFHQSSTCCFIIKCVVNYLLEWYVVDEHIFLPMNESIKWQKNM